MRTLAVIALKGGSGKTTVATHLALGAHLRGVDTLLVDIDPQFSARDILSARETPGPECVTSSGRNVLAAQFGALSQRKELLIIDTPAGAVEAVSEAIVIADFALLVVRPTLIDLSGLARTLMLVRKLGKACAVVVNQAPVARENVEAPLVKRALKGLDYMQAPLAPVILRSRSIYQTALERGRSAEEMTDRAAAREIAALCDFVQARMAAKPDEA
ncbi:MAG: AAA family ATPase [Pseudomonadota bacterium]|uniref:AAA family ATPase n=1 Tax=unclassified Phenylobacterium TaxID=2640670 RepID=UPI000AD8C551|nr:MULTISPECIES: AAA family ATPase [unclassified Phenylobacterium]MBT9473739.1 AAA family ATPase [Phenylobacterium sp.]